MRSGRAAGRGWPDANGEPRTGSFHAQRAAIMATSLAWPAGPYVQAVAVQAGTLLFMSGIVARDASGVIATGDVGVQTRLILERARAILTTAGGDLADIIKMTVYLRDPHDYVALNDVRPEGLSEGQFASTTVKVA